MTDAPGLSAQRLDDMPAPWPEVLRLAWESWQAGSVPVGAVVVDPAGVVVARGRNRSAEPDGPPGQLYGTYLAHAEVNAMACLPRGHYMDHAVYTSLAPCGYCSMALRHAHFGAVHFAAEDPLWTDVAAALPGLSAHLARGWHTRHGPLDGPAGRFATLLPMLHGLYAARQSPVHADYRAAWPELGALAERLVADGTAADLKHTPADDAFAALTATHPELWRQ